MNGNLVGGGFDGVISRFDERYVIVRRQPDGRENGSHSVRIEGDCENPRTASGKVFERRLVGVPVRERDIDIEALNGMPE